MEDKELLDHLTKSAKKDFEYFTNPRKEKRERWVIEEFLSIIGVEFKENELSSPEQKSKVDVHFRDARFQVKEIMDPNFKRGKFYKDAYHSLKNATSLDQVSLVGEAHDLPCIARMYDLVLEQAIILANDKRYNNLKGSLDLLIYVTRPRCSPIENSEIDVNDYLSVGWRSVSCINSRQSIVLFSSHDAPEFLKNISGKVIKNNDEQGSMTVNQNPSTEFKPSQWFSIIITYLSMPIILLVCGGDLGWWQAWVFFVLIVTAGVGGRIGAEQRHPGILAERFKSFKARDVKPWDRVTGPLMALSLSFPLVIVAGLDHRFAWSPHFPVWVNLLGLLLTAVGYAFATWALIENRFFSTFVRIQKDRGHEVCSSGPYRIVRHPGYAGNVLALPGIVLALGSVWTLIPVATAIIIAVIRTELEDRTLQEELNGYKEYAQQVRYRLIPGIY